MKYNIGDTVKIRVCDFNGLIISAKVDGTMPIYEVTYPDQHGLPTSKAFWEIELEDVYDGKWGFGRGK
ncbi:hypothetical protein LCGC14_3046990 [marine sediment metagenome]|uniref:Uncharacterized protein n=1 Tax=marine sediment metagenome TaxID=412755 RepID=A0A0F8ZDR7_9ZZZZ|nr:hypothetical protein [Candidatus Scalindua sp.]